MVRRQQLRQAQLTRGEKITEILKQPQYQPQPQEDQVVLLYAATKGYLTKIETARLQEWAHSFIGFLHEKHPEITQSIAETKALSDDGAKALVAAIEEFNKSF